MRLPRGRGPRRFLPAFYAIAARLALLHRFFKTDLPRGRVLHRFRRFSGNTAAPRDFVLNSLCSTRRPASIALKQVAPARTGCPKAPKQAAMIRTGCPAMLPRAQIHSRAPHHMNPCDAALCLFMIRLSGSLLSYNNIHYNCR